MDNRMGISMSSTRSGRPEGKDNKVKRDWIVREGY